MSKTQKKNLVIDNRLINNMAGGADLFDPKNEESVQAMIKRILEKEQIQQSYSEQAPRQFRRFIELENPIDVSDIDYYRGLILRFREAFMQSTTLNKDSKNLYLDELIPNALKKLKILEKPVVINETPKNDIRENLINKKTSWLSGEIGLDSFGERIINTHWVFDNYLLLEDNGNSREGTISNMIKTLENPEISDIFKKIYSEEILAKYKTLLEKSKIYYGSILGRFNIGTYSNEIRDELEAFERGYQYANRHVIKYVNENDEFYFFINSFDHAMGAYYKKIDEENYAFYYTNSGGGIGYQNPVSGDANTGIMGFIVKKEKLIRFLSYELVLELIRAKTENFYNIILKDLLDESYQIKSDMYIDEYPNLKLSIVTPSQVKGDCSFRSVIYMLEIITRDANLNSPTENYLNMNLSDKYKIFYYLGKILIIKNFVEKVMSRTEPNTITFFYPRIQMYIESFIYLQTQLEEINQLCTTVGITDINPTMIYEDTKVQVKILGKRVNKFIDEKHVFNEYL